MPIDVSNVKLYCSKCNRGVRFGRRFTDEGQKQRYCKTCGTSLGNVGPRKAARARTAQRPKLLTTTEDTNRPQVPEPLTVSRCRALGS